MCSSCQLMSIGEKEIESILLELNLEYKQQVIFDDCYHIKPLRFDFGVYNDDNLLFLIEYQGKQHYEPVDFFGGEDSFEQQCIRDKIKVEYCNKNNIPLYAISYNENTRDKLISILKEYLLLKEDGEFWEEKSQNKN